MTAILSRDEILRIPPEAHTLAGFRAWALSEDVPEKLPVSFLSGQVLIDMSKEEIATHALVKTEVGRVLGNLNEERDLGHLFINGVLVTNEDADVANNPDLVLVLWERLESGLVSYVKKNDRLVEIGGSPNLVVEIVSDGSVVKDTRNLREAYQRAGIPEYWIIDARGPEIVFQILNWRKAGYVALAVKNGWTRSKTLGRECKLTRKRDRSGTWKYSLALRTDA